MRISDWSSDVCSSDLRPFRISPKNMSSGKSQMLKIENLHATVADKPILKGLSLSINAGEIHAIMGPNGAGKSTVYYVLGGRQGYEETEGSVMGSEERRVGKECVSTGRSRWSPVNKKK